MILYRYVGIPPSWGNVSSKDIEVSELKFRKITEALDKISKKPVQILVIGQVAPIVNYIVEKNSINSIRGIDFSEYFASTFDKENNFEVKISKFTVVYNVGLEKALNLSFSKQLLKGLIQKIKDNGSHLLLQTSKTATQISTDYELQFKNVLRLPEKQEEKIL